jgi:hypothetical protein
MTDGAVIAVDDDAEVRAAWVQPEEPIDDITQLQLALAELADLVTGGVS